MDPYAGGKIVVSPYYKKSDIEGVCVAILDLRMHDRNLELIIPMSRVLREGEIHEFIATEQNSSCGGRVDDIAYVAFYKIVAGGVVVRGDTVLLHEKPLGHIAGYDETHMPNHLNIVFRVSELKTGKELGIALGDKVIIRRNAEETT